MSFYASMSDLPGAPVRLPGGSWGGVRGPNSKGHFPYSLSWNRLKIYIDYEVDFGSLWGRSWLALGGHVGLILALGRPKLVPKPSSNRLHFEKANFHADPRFPSLFAFFSPKMGPYTAQVRPQTDPTSSGIAFFLLICRFDF